jgi:hypothetical protein
MRRGLETEWVHLALLEEMARVGSVGAEVLAAARAWGDATAQRGVGESAVSAKR